MSETTHDLKQRAEQSISEQLALRDCLECGGLLSAHQRLCIVGVAIDLLTALVQPEQEKERFGYLIAFRDRLLTQCREARAQVAQIQAEMRQETFRSGDHPALGVPVEQVHRWEGRLSTLAAMLEISTEPLAGNGGPRS